MIEKHPNQYTHTPQGLRKRSLLQFTADFFTSENDHNPVVAKTCPDCHGRGYQLDENSSVCETCRGVGAFELGEPFFNDGYPEFEIAVAAEPNSKGFVSCPFCRKKFQITANNHWTGLRHGCGQKIALVGPNADQCWRRRYDDDWRDLVYRYLKACQEDGQERERLDRTGERSRFVEAHGTKRMRSTEGNQSGTGIGGPVESLGSKDEYKIVEQSVDEVHVYVEAHASGYPHRLSRFYLSRNDTGWQLDEVYTRCYCPSGYCIWCDIDAYCIACKGKGDCKLCKGEGYCIVCMGTRRCRGCRTSDRPGWIDTYADREQVLRGFMEEPEIPDLDALL